MLLNKTLAGLSLATTAFIATPSAQAAANDELEQLRQQLDILAEQVEANSAAANSSDTTVGGYGEMHYNNLSDGAGSVKKEIDFHRFVLFFGHQFSDKVRFFSELEVEHGTIADTATGSSPGSVAIEQAYVQIDMTDSTSFIGGIILTPVGFINETHEPPTFYGVERNVINKYILPTTWREGGVGIVGKFDSGLRYDLIVHSGLDGGTSIRGGRQKVAEATANNLAVTGRIKYTGIAGLELAASAQYQSDMTQDKSDDVGSATLLQAHVRYSISKLTLTALHAQWNIDVAATASANERAKDVQTGSYVEASWRFNPAWGVFVRQNNWDNGGTGDTARAQTDFGLSYWPHEDVVIKADYQIQNTAAGNMDGFNLGIGYQF